MNEENMHKNRLFALMAFCLLFISGQSISADFSGTWKLDKKTSKDLPKSFQGVDSYLLHITQSKDSMVVQVEMTGQGQKVMLPISVYQFDGKEVYREDTLRGSKRWTKASWTSTGQKMIVTNRVIQKANQPLEEHYDQTDVWQFSKKRNTLLIFVTQKFEDTSKPTHTERRYFHRIGD